MNDVQKDRWNANHAESMRVLVDFFLRPVRLGTLQERTHLTHDTLGSHLRSMLKKGMVIELKSGEWILKSKAVVKTGNIVVLAGNEYRSLTSVVSGPSPGTVVVVRAEGSGAEIRATSPESGTVFQAELTTSPQQKCGTIIAAVSTLNVEARTTGSIPGMVQTLETFTFEMDVDFAKYLEDKDLIWGSSQPAT